MPRVELSRDARQDPLGIATCIIRESGSEQRGDAFLDTVFATCETLASQPDMGEMRTEFKTGLIRSFSVGNYET